LAAETSYDKKKKRAYGNRVERKEPTDSLKKATLRSFDDTGTLSAKIEGERA